MQRPLPRRGTPWNLERAGSRASSPDVVGLFEPYPEGSLHPVLVRVPPGEGIPRSHHRHANEIVFILEGDGTVLTEGEDIPVRRGDSLHFPATCIHGLRAGPHGIHLLCIHDRRVGPGDDLYLWNPTEGEADA